MGEAILKDSGQDLKSRNFREMAARAVELYGIDRCELVLLEQKKNVTFRVERPSGERFLLRLCRLDNYPREVLESEAVWLRALRREASLEVQDPVRSRAGAFVATAPAVGNEDSRPCQLFRWLPGQPLEEHLDRGTMERLGELLARLHDFGAHFEPPPGFERPRFDLSRVLGDGQVLPAGCAETLVSARQRRMLDEAARLILECVAALDEGPDHFGIIHTDPEPDNVLYHEGSLHPIDFADCGWGYFLYDVAAALLPLGQKADFPALRAALLQGYRRHRALPEAPALLDAFLVARGLFATRWMLLEGWASSKVRAYATAVVPHILAEVRRFLDTHGDSTADGGTTARMTTARFLAHLRGLGVKLRVEGDRLRLRAPRGALDEDLRRELGERKPELLGFLKRSTLPAGAPPIAPRGAPPPEGVPLSFAQQRLWLIDRLDPASPAYNISQTVRLDGELNVAVLERAFNEIVRRQGSLRTTFGHHRSKPVQKVAPRLVLKLPVIDLSALAEVARDAEVARLRLDEASRAFDLTRGPLVRLRLLRHGASRHDLLSSMHHIISDGWSAGVFIREMVVLYEAFSRRQSSPLSELRIQYTDFALWQRAWLRGEALERQLEHWRQQLSGAPEVMELPFDRPRSPRTGARGGRSDHTLPLWLSDELKACGQDRGATLFMVSLAGFLALLHRLGGGDDLVVGSPIANRSRSELEELIGFFVNTLVLRASLAGDPTFLELVERLRETTLAAYAHQDLPFEKLVEELGPERSLSHTPLFQVAFSLQNASLPDLTARGLSATRLGSPATTEKFDLTLSLQESLQGIEIVVRYKRDLFDATTVERLVRQLESLCADAVRHPRRRLSRLSLLAPATRHQLLREWNDLPATLDEGPPVHRAVSHHARTAPHAVAVFGSGGEALSYGELEAGSRRLARRLQSLGIGPEARVAVDLERSPREVVALLAVWKAGGAYLPLDPEVPARRRRFMIADSGAAVLLSENGDLTPPPGCAVFDPASGEASANAASARRTAVRGHPAHLAYVIYTSGSTGRPKGVEIEHRQLRRLVDWHASTFRVSPHDRATRLSGQAFDASVWELWPYLMAGASVSIPPESVRASPPALRGWLVAREITLGFVATPVAERLLAEPWPASTALRLLLTGGDALRRHPPAGLPFLLVNNYGPTEGTVVATSTPLRPEIAGAPALGRPIAGTSAHVVDGHGRPTPLGVAGELRLGGPQLSRGYRGRPGLTAERFGPDPFSATPGTRLYHTGDLVRSRADGQLEFLGRIDHQIQLRGLRIELGEIEAELAATDGVAAAVVVLSEAAAEPQLAAFVTSNGLSSAELRHRLGARLPSYMVPASITLLDALPLTSNGKVDRRALARRPLAETRTEDDAEAPVSPSEEIVTGIWCEVLGRERIGRDESFFECGGHSLVATQMLARIRDVFELEMPLRAVFETPTVAGLAERIDRGRRPEEAGLEVAAGGEPVLSFAQQRLWFLDELQPGSSAYNISGALRLIGRLSPAALERALSEITRRHESLRTRFPSVDGSPRPVVAENLRLAFPIVSLGRLPRDRADAEARRLARREARRPFRLETGPLLRHMLLVLGPEEHVLVLSLHHIVADGWSMGVLLREAGALYRAYVAGEASPLAELPAQYGDFARWQRSRLAGERLKAGIAHWRRQLRGLPPRLELPTDRPRPSLQSFAGAVQPIEIDAQLTAELHRFARRCEATLFMVLLAAFQALLGRWSGQSDLAVGSPVAGRLLKQTEPLIGLFVNTLVLRTRLDPGLTFRELLVRVRYTALDAHAHQEIPFEQLVETLVESRDLSANPLFQVMLSLHQAAAADPLRVPGLETRPLPASDGSAKFDLLLSLEAGGTSLRGSLEYATALFDATTAARLGRRFESLLRHVTESPEHPLEALPWLSPPERQQLVREWQGPPLAAAAGLLHRPFERQVERRPEALAVRHGAEHLTYGGLSSRAERLAERLRGLGIGAEDRVGIALRRRPRLLVALLAVLKSGGAYVPLDPSYPRRRLRLLAADAHLRAVLTEPAIRPRLPSSAAAVLEVDADSPTPDPRAEPGRPARPQNLAYLIYTSGSTGRPKGVAITHANARALVDWGLGLFGRDDLDRVLAATSINFDLSVFELFMPLAAGTAVELVRDALALTETEAAVTLVNTVPSAAAALVRQEGFPASTAIVNLAGEPLTRALANEVFAVAPAVALYNLYGPSEDTTYSTWERVGRGREPTIGRPVAGTHAYVLDRRLLPVGIGERGELALAGRGLARGYLGRARTTAERFVPSSLGDGRGERLYRTGDLVRPLADGRLAFLGRVDHQVKLRGFRIELGEIEASLRGLPAVTESAVLVIEPGKAGDRRLVAAYAGAAAPPADEVREVLGRRLPQHMVPSDFLPLAALPRLPNGKLDRAELARQIASAREQAGDERLGPRTAAERELVKIWEELLGRKDIGVRDDFFALGGHSLLSVRLLARIRHRFGVRLPTTAVFEAPTVEALAARLERGEAERGPLVVLREGGERPPLFLVHPVGGEVLCYGDLMRALGSEQPAYGLQASAPHAGNGSIADLAKRYLRHVRRARPLGPRHLGGWSMGALVAFEMARRLEAAGELPEQVTMIDPPAPAADATMPFDEVSLCRGFARDLLRLAGAGADATAEVLATNAVEATVEELLERLARSGLVPAELELRERFEVFAANARAMRSYRSGPYGGRLLLVPAADAEGALSRERRQALAGWRQLARGGIEVHPLQGNHYSILQPPTVEDLARRMLAGLAR